MHSCTPTLMFSWPLQQNYPCFVALPLVFVVTVRRVVVGNASYSYDSLSLPSVEIKWLISKRI